MAVVDFRPRYKSKPRFDLFKGTAQNAELPRVQFNWASINRGFRGLAHFSLCAALGYASYHVYLGVERIQAYVTPYLG